MTTTIETRPCFLGGFIARGGGTFGFGRTERGARRNLRKYLTRRKRGG